MCLLYYVWYSRTCFPSLDFSIFQCWGLKYAYASFIKCKVLFFVSIDKTFCFHKYVCQCWWITVLMYISIHYWQNHSYNLYNYWAESLQSKSPKTEKLPLQYLIILIAWNYLVRTNDIDLGGGNYLAIVKYILTRLGSTVSKGTLFWSKQSIMGFFWYSPPPPLSCSWSYEYTVLIQRSLLILLQRKSG